MWRHDGDVEVFVMMPCYMAGCPHEERPGGVFCSDGCAQAYAELSPEHKGAVAYTALRRRGESPPPATGVAVAASAPARKAAP